METWRDEARCAAPELDPNWWFADPSEEDDPADIAQARQQMCAARDICRLCPVRSECLEHAMYRPFLYGIWGGLSGEERTTLRKIRARNDKTLVFGLFPEGTNLNRQPDPIIAALRARRICGVCGEEKDYPISKSLGRCRDCAVAAREAQ